MGIILEDDCLPSQSFFLFSQELLGKYKDDERIMQVSGDCFMDDLDIKESYYFSQYCHIWGWATWKRAWNLYELENKNFESDFTKLKFNSIQEKKYWHKTFKDYFAGNINTWDYPWVFTVWKNNGLSIYPKINMVKNIGCGIPDSTHILKPDSRIEKMKAVDIDSNITHPHEVVTNPEFDRLNFKVNYTSNSTIIRIIEKIKNLIN